MYPMIIYTVWDLGPVPPTRGGLAYCVRMAGPCPAAHTPGSNAPASVWSRAPGEIDCQIAGNESPLPDRRATQGPDRIKCILSTHCHTLV